jgi:phosphoribosylaminoimidazolecarboxamide formyltransferase/IMP cyclohydrolase
VLRKVGVPFRTVTEVTGASLRASVGTSRLLHSSIHAGNLARRHDASEMAQLQEQGIEPIDMVVCNLLPVAGAALVRAGARNYLHVAVVVRPRDYPDMLRPLDDGGSNMVETRRWLAAFALQHTATYDTLVAERLRGGTAKG